MGAETWLSAEGEGVGVCASTQGTQERCHCLGEPPSLSILLVNICTHALKGGLRPAHVPCGVDVAPVTLTKTPLKPTDIKRYHYT